MLTVLSRLVLAGGIVAAIWVLAWRAHRARQWQAALVAYRLTVPARLDLDAVVSVLGMLSGMTVRRPIVFEIAADRRGIGNYLLVPRGEAGTVLGAMRTSLPGVRTDEAPGYLKPDPVRLPGAATEYRCSCSWRPLASHRAAGAMAGVLNALSGLGPDEWVCAQWIVTGARAVLPRGDLPAPVAGAVRDKQAAPLLDAAGRIGAWAPHPARAAAMVTRVAVAWRMLDAPGAFLKPRKLRGRR